MLVWFCSSLVLGAVGVEDIWQSIMILLIVTMILIYREALKNLFLFRNTRSYAALRAADLDWIIGPGYSSGRYILGCCQSLAQLGLDIVV